MVRVLWGAVCARRGPFSIGHGQYQGHWGRVWEKRESKEVGKGETGGSRGERRA